MTLRIEAISDGRTVTLQLSGRVEAEHLVQLGAQMRAYSSQFALDLSEVTLVDVAFVRLLIDCEWEGIEVRNCPPYVREWMGRERSAMTRAARAKESK